MTDLPATAAYKNCTTMNDWASGEVRTWVLKSEADAMRDELLARVAELEEALANVVRDEALLAADLAHPDAEEGT